MTSVEYCALQEEAGLSTYVLSCGEWMLKVSADMGFVSEKVTTQEYKKQEKRARKPLLGMFFFLKVSRIADERTWQWLNGGFLTKATVRVFAFFTMPFYYFAFII